MRTPALMVLGTGSYAGKSALAAGICRLFRDAGYRVAPFKAQNMSLNSAAAEGGEIGRAQAVQAAACGLTPTADMNPVLLKPQGPHQCQLIVRGRARGVLSSREHGRYGGDVIASIRAAYAGLAARAEVMVIEGAGSPAEINLLDRDFANMWMAEEADAACVLVADIERGGAFAALYGTWALAPSPHRIRGFVFNKFRGEKALLDTGLARLEALTGVATLGVVPYRETGLPEEDSLGLPGPGSDAPRADLCIGVVRFPFISNFTDFEPLQREPGVEVRYVWDPAEAEACDVLILPGTKSTVADLERLRARGLAESVRRMAGAGKPVLGICGGFQMLGRSIADPEKVESERVQTAGLDLLPVETEFERDKRVEPVRGRELATGIGIAGYAIQHGRVRRTGGEAWIELEAGQEDGCALGRIWGTSIHGLFEAPEFRAAVLARWRAWTGAPAPAAGALASLAADASLEARLDQWAAYLRQHLDVAALFALANLEVRRA